MKAIHLCRAKAGRLAAIAVVTILSAAIQVNAGGAAQLPTTVADFFQPGTQPDLSGGKDFDPIITSFTCSFCHDLPEPVEVPIYNRWAGSMMANSARDPLFFACLAIANQDAPGSGELCLRCHAPGAWLAGRSNPPDGSALTFEDRDGINCNFCHRMVDPVYKEGISPRRDEPILQALSDAGLLPVQPGGAKYVIDPDDARRGPFSDVPLNLHGVPIVPSPFHLTSEMCGTCHEVSNPALVKKEDGSYIPDMFDLPHPTQNTHHMFPHDRTYSEWANSQYATVGVDHGGLFGGNHPTGIMRSCQDCHMPLMETFGCAFQEKPFFIRPNVPQHDFNGGNAWVQNIVKLQYPDDVSSRYLDESVERARMYLQKAATMTVNQDACDLVVRIENQTGHKLPTGYAEGRRMWIHVLFEDDIMNPVAERGFYDFNTADLTTADTKVYEAVFGLDAAMAKRTGLPEGPSFHFALNNKIFKDNRIPPRGFTNEAFEAVQAAPVDATFEDGQYWDETRFRVPPGATKASVILYYQTASKEYITFLRDENRTNNAGNELFFYWHLTEMSPPVKMAAETIQKLTAGEFADADCDGDVDLDDYRILSGCVGGSDNRLSLGCESLDFDLDGDVDLFDVAALQREFTGS